MKLSIEFKILIEETIKVFVDFFVGDDE